MTILTKCNALGNDFLILDCISHPQNHEFINEENIKTVSHRRFGIGCDQFIVLEKSQKADAKIVFYNTDGSRAEACGNGTVACSVYVAKLLRKTEVFLETDVKIAKCVVNGNEATVELPKAEVLEFDEKQIQEIGKETIRRYYPEAYSNKDEISNIIKNINAVNVGNPHCVILMKNFRSDVIIATDEKFASIGKTIENLTEIFPNRTNVEFVVQTGENAFDCFIWERGSGATLACGTGACAVARAVVKNGLANEAKPIFVTMAGSFQNGKILPMKVELKNTCTLFTNTVSFTGKVSL